MSDNPVQDLIDQLKLMRVELGDVKKRQLTEERLKHLQAALEDNAKQIEGVRHAAAHGGKEGAERLSYDLSNKSAQISQKPVERPQAPFWPVGVTLASFAYSQPLQGLPQALCLRWSCSIISWSEILRTAFSSWGGIGPVPHAMDSSRIRITVELWFRKARIMVPKGTNLKPLEYGS